MENKTKHLSVAFNWNRVRRYEKALTDWAKSEWDWEGTEQNGLKWPHSLSEWDRFMKSLTLEMQPNFEPVSCPCRAECILLTNLINVISTVLT